MKKWHDHIPTISAVEFNRENSGLWLSIPAPYQIAGLHDDQFVKQMWFMPGSDWEFHPFHCHPVGKTSNPIRLKSGMIAIMFEDEETLDRAWWHYEQ